MTDGVTRAAGTVGQRAVNNSGQNGAALASDYNGLSASQRATGAASAPVARERFRFSTDSGETERVKKQVEATAKATGQDEFAVVREMRKQPGANQQVLANLDRYYYARDLMRDAVKSGNVVDMTIAAGVGAVGGTVDALVKVVQPSRGRSDPSIGGITNTAAGALAGLTAK